MYFYVPDPEGCVWDHRFQFWIDLPPVTWKRPIAAVTKFGNVYEYNDNRMEKQQHKIRTIFHEFAAREGRLFDYPFQGVAMINTQSFFKKPKKYQNLLLPCDVNKDVDNLGKLVIDALQCITRVKMSYPDPVTKKRSKLIRRFGAWNNDKSVILMMSGKAWAPDNFERSFVQIDFYRRTNERITIQKPGRFRIL